MSTSFTKHTAEAVDQLDAVFFTGDQFFDTAARAEMREMMSRWERRLKEFDIMGEENDDGKTPRAS